MADNADDKFSARTTAVAMLLRAFAWPLVILIALWYYGPSVERILLATQKVSVAGVEIERWVSKSNLSDAQLKQLSGFTSDEILGFVTRFGDHSRMCIDAKTVPPEFQMYQKAGLIQVNDGSCGETNASLSTSEDGQRLVDAIRNAIKSMLDDQLLQNKT